MSDRSDRPITTAAQVHALAAACVEHHARVSLVDRRGLAWTLTDTDVGAVLVSADSDMIYAPHVTEAQVTVYEWQVVTPRDGS